MQRKDEVETENDGEINVLLCPIFSQIPSRHWYLDLPAASSVYGSFVEASGWLCSSVAEDAAQSVFLDKSTIKTAKLNSVSSLSQSGPHFVSTEAHSFSLKCLNVAAL